MFGVFLHDVALDDCWGHANAIDASILIPYLLVRILTPIFLFETLMILALLNGAIRIRCGLHGLL